MILPFKFYFISFFLTYIRLGELIFNSIFDPLSNVSRSTNIKCGIASNGLKYMNFHLPHTKTKAHGEDVNITDSTCPCSPISAFEHHLLSNSDIPSNAPLFAYETGNGTWSPLKRSWFLRRCNKIWEKDGLSAAKGHGFRIGGTTHLLLLGVDPWIVMVQGRWSSQAFLTYWRRCEEVLSLFIGFSFQSHESILATMKNFKSRLTG